jgi:putative methyltransferase (TIGR04325 family)
MRPTPLHHWLPPALLPAAQHFLATSGLRDDGLFRGRCASWAAARAASTGYDTPRILERVSAAIGEVLAGHARFERDSVLLERPEWPWPALFALARQAALDGGRLRVIDFGGSLGSSFLAARPFLGGLAELRWHVVEQPAFVERARTMPFPAAVRFFTTIEAAAAGLAPNVVLASGVLHYLEHPFETLDALVALGAATLVVDRTPVIDELDDVLTVQHVPARIFDASYPCWLFSPDRIPMHTGDDYRLLAELPALDRLLFERRFVRHAGWLFERRTAAAPVHPRPPIDPEGSSQGSPTP